MQNKFGLWALIFLLYACCMEIVAQESHSMYRIQLTDKENTPYSLDSPQDFLSERAIERRKRQNLSLNESDLPVNPYYLAGIEECGVQIVTSSKWNNSSVVSVTDTLVVKKLAALPFVKEIKKVWSSPAIEGNEQPDRRMGVTNQVKQYDSFYGAGEKQITLHQGEKLHQAGFWGEGMQVAVIDAGFYNVDLLSAFKEMHLLGVRDFVNPNSDIYDQNYHGMKVLSCMAAYLPNSLVGTAPKASYWLLRSEDEASEQLVEEDYWAAAIEFADSAGVDIVNTSLGYYEFDQGWGNYSYRELDGYTSLMSYTASMVASKGMVMVCSAGNTGNKAWKKITPPADAKDILAVGAINREKVNADFSSVGNTSDGRIKPDVMAVGLRTSIIENNGIISQANGTSFASPIICGLVTCFWQACPWLTAYQVIERVREAGDRTNEPDNIFGYGIPNIWEAYQTAVKETKESKESATDRSDKLPK
ncbi:MAG: S8 family peptidase [Phocaeicola sp.]